MRVHHFLATGETRRLDSLEPILEALTREREPAAERKIDHVIACHEDFGRRILEDARTRSIDGVAFLSAWLRRENLEATLALSLHGLGRAALDGFVPHGRGAFLAARPQGLVAMWLAGNLPTLPVFSLVPALLAKDVALLKLASADPAGTHALISVLAESEGGSVRGADLVRQAALVWFDHREKDLNERLSLAADARVVWGGRAAVNAIGALPRQPHATEAVFGPKYSLAVLGRKRLEREEGLDAVLAAIARDAAVFDQRACSSPHTVFIEKNGRLGLEATGERLARHLEALPPKRGQDAHTSLAIASARAEWAMSEGRSVIVPGLEPSWTVCLDRETSLKAPVASRTLFLTEVASWREILPILGPEVQTCGISFEDDEEARAFAERAGLRGVARCVRPGLMHLYESPWDGKMLLDPLVRWVTLRP
ncbi:MAG TPA: acyl-CoA reductase [Planctomycetota bacterium]|nr:acyl-CoA reductase [Planctomycetota bacterium]